MKVGFFIFLIQSWVGTNSSYQLMPALSSGFETMGYKAGGAEEMVKEYSKINPDSNIKVQSNQIVTNALNFFNIFWEHAQQQNLLTIFTGHALAAYDTEYGDAYSALLVMSVLNPLEGSLMITSFSLVS